MLQKEEAEWEREWREKNAAFPPDNDEEGGGEAKRKGEKRKRVPPSRATLSGCRRRRRGDNDDETLPPGGAFTEGSLSHLHSRLNWKKGGATAARKKTRQRLSPPLQRDQHIKPRTGQGGETYKYVLPRPHRSQRGCLFLLDTGGRASRALTGRPPRTSLGGGKRNFSPFPLT